MSKSISLHIGLDAVDPKQYEGWSGALQACEADAKDMYALAIKQKFTERRILLTNRATSSLVVFYVSQAAKHLKSGDLFWLTYSGHGGQVPDRNGEEKDRQDETWCLFDREMIDDEIYSLFAKFAAGVRILVLSDSCHSGTVTRKAPRDQRKGRFRLMPPAIAARVYAAHKGQYDAIQKAVKPAAKAVVKASVILISGCQDNQYSEDGDRNGLFTGAVRKVWNGGKWAGSHLQFRNVVAALMPEWQTPNYYVVGKPMPTFEKQVPFTR